MFVSIDNIVLNTNEVVLIRKYSSACICVVVKSPTSADVDNAHVMSLDTLTPEQFISSFMNALKEIEVGNTAVTNVVDKLRSDLFGFDLNSFLGESGNR